MFHSVLLLPGVVCLASLLVSGPAAPAPPDSCPNAEVSCVGYERCHGRKRHELAATIVGGDPQITPTFHWCVTAGKIVSGQGTGAIVVDVSEVSEERVRVILTVDGFIKYCDVSDIYLIELSEGADSGAAAPGG